MSENYKMIQTKVSPEAYSRIKSIERKKGISSYGLIQMMVDTSIRYMDDRHNLTYEMEKAMSIFEHMEGWQNALNLADPNTHKVIGEAIYFLYDEDGKKKGSRGVHVVKPVFGNWTEDENIQHIIERVLCLLIPERYRRLRSIATELGCSSQLELLDYIVNYFIKECDLIELRKGFADADRAENGRPQVFGARTRRKKHYSPNEMQDEQHIIRFTEEDKNIIDNSNY